MYFKRIYVVVSVLFGLFVSGMKFAVGQSASVGRSTRATNEPDAARLPPAADLIYKYVMRRNPADLRWRQIPWLIDLSDGIRQARAENRPVLLFVSGDEPLSRC